MNVQPSRPVIKFGHLFASRLMIGLLLGCACSAMLAAQKCAVPGTVSSSVKQDMITWTDCTQDKNWRQEFSTPSRARVFPFKQKIFSQSFGTYPDDLTKVDIIWLDETVTINQPLNSFGGDIIIYADTVNINAPIDSRVYIEQGVDHFADGNPHALLLDHGSLGKTWVNTTKTSDAIAAHPAYTAAFNDYLTRCNDCSPDGTRKPEMPYGIVTDSPLGIGFPNLSTRDGAPAPDFSVVNRQATRSGNIYIYARIINVKSELLQPEIPKFRADCEGLPTTFHPFAINAGGLRGGRGGLGSVSQAVKHPPSTGDKYYFDEGAEHYQMLGGFSGSGGPGGDAGNVTIVYLNSPPIQGGVKVHISSNKKSPSVDEPKAIADSLSDEIAKITNVQGGEPGDTNKYRTPAAEGPNASGSNRCTFKLSTPYPDQPAGADGKLSVKTEKNADGFISALALVSAKNLRLDYDLPDYLVVAQRDDKIYSTSPSSVISEFLVQTLVNAEIKHVTDVINVFSSGQIRLVTYHRF